jgi:molecular chaperone GrpE
VLLYSGRSSYGVEEAEAPLPDDPTGEPDEHATDAPSAPREAGSSPAAASPPVEEGGAVAWEPRARLAEARVAEVLEAYRQLKTDNEAHRDRTTRNLERRFDQRKESLLLKFMDILDNLDRALEAAQTAYADQSLLEGLILVRSQLLQTLQDEGLERIPVLGLPFDPHVSEAVGTQPVSDPDQNGIVLKEHMRGYRLHGKVARASRVVTGLYVAEAGAATAPGAAAPGGADALESDLTLEQIIARAEAVETPAPTGEQTAIDPADEEGN